MSGIPSLMDRVGACRHRVCQSGQYLSIAKPFRDSEEGPARPATASGRTWALQFACDDCDSEGLLCPPTTWEMYAAR